MPISQLVRIESKSVKLPATVRIVTVEQIYAMDGRTLNSFGESHNKVKYL